MTEPKKIYFEDLIDIFSFKYKEPTQRPEGTISSWGETDVDKIFSDYEGYIESVKNRISINDLDDFIKISEPNTEKEFVQEAIYEYFTKYTITIKNLTIITSDTYIVLSPASFHIDKWYIESLHRSRGKYKNEYTDGINIIFEKNTFIRAADEQSNCKANISLTSGSYITFCDNEFKQVDLGVYFADEEYIFTDLIKNTFDNQRVITGNVDKQGVAYTHLGGRVKPNIVREISVHKQVGEKVNELHNKDLYDTVEKIKNTQKSYTLVKNGLQEIIQLLLYFNEKINVLPEHISPQPITNRNMVRIIDNQLNQLRFSGAVNFYFRGINNIEQIILEGNEANIHWGPYQELDEDGQYAHSHKQLFLTLKARAIENQDKFQELIYQREIAKCDWAIIKDENLLTSFQNKMVLLVGWAFSDHGTSWLRPFIYLIIVNTIVAGCYSHSKCPNPEYWNTYWQLLNPFSNLIKDVRYCTSDQTLLYFLTGFQKLFYLGMSYEIIRVFRRFTAK